MLSARREWQFSMAIAAISFILFFINLAPPGRDDGGRHARAVVTAVDDQHVRTNQIVKTGFQVLRVELLSGSQKGQTMTVTNQLTGKLEFDELYTGGSQLLIEYGLEEGQPAHGMARGHYRIHWQGLLIGLYVVLLVLVAGVTGLKAALSFLFAAMVLWKLFFPLLLLGFAPVPTGLVIVAVLTAAVTFSVGGLNRRGLTTFIGSMLGVTLTCVLAVVFAESFRLNGAVRPFAESLLYSGYYDLRLTEIFIASVFIACSGAVMDLAMDIAASMEEIKLGNPGIGFFAHLGAGFRVGRAVVGTMTTTLLLAYSSSHIFMFMLVMAKGLPAANILNAPFVSAEILNILVGSFGLVTVAPFTAVVAALLYRSGKTAPAGSKL
ncbi:MAG: YibE/F family protein [Lamprobacter sp.]|uniref:YibE/F family protein n=1 Tax=Lamprobacter sp. TaxID=3100796 RepID=UPI002B25A70C|nr:YibE/F family protein [Lamprobacter sp.]MEA3638393.1 YibE/F family protein [Lamprobacter sp.]